MWILLEQAVPGRRISVLFGVQDQLHFTEQQSNTVKHDRTWKSICNNSEPIFDIINAFIFQGAVEDRKINIKVNFKDIWWCMG
jgi:hypothetical protein